LSDPTAIHTSSITQSFPRSVAPAPPFSRPSADRAAPAEAHSRAWAGGQGAGSGPATGSGDREAWGSTQHSRKVSARSPTAAPGPRAQHRARPAGPVSIVQDDGLGIAPVALVVASPMAEVDPTDGRDVVRHAPRSSDHCELLMVGAETADPLVGQHLTAGVVHDLPDVRVLLLGVPLLVGMGSPHQPMHVAPRRTASARTDPSSVPGPASRCPASPRQSRNHTWSPGPRLDSSWCSRAK